MNEGLQLRTIVVGVDQNGNDMLPPITTANGAASDNDPVIVEDGQICPPVCADPSPLNS
jgi:hypothetical protein